MGNPRTCIGCRGQDDRSRLLRVVAEEGSAAVVRIVPDPAARLGGRGAWIHPTPQCVEQAERRRAFSRALRLAGSVTIAEVLVSVGTGRPPHTQLLDTEVGND